MTMAIDKFDKILKDRCRRLAKAVSAKGYDAMLLTDASNVRYFTGFSGHDSWAVVAGSRVYLVTDSRYTEQAQGECPACSVICRKGSIIDETAKILARCRSVESLAVEEDISLKACNGLKNKTRVRIRPVSGVIEKLRMIKSEPEVESIVKASEIAVKAVSNALKTLRVGMAESELAGRIEFEMRILGSAASFDTIVAFGANGSRPHHFPGQTKLRKNDVILIDFGAVYNGYCSDMTRCYAVGRVSSEYLKAYEAVKAAQAAGIAAIESGLSMEVPDSAAREQIKTAGFPQYGHGTGHGLGLDVHEFPAITKLCKQKLEAGQVLTVEPGIYLPGQFGIRIEDDILVTETGCRVLTRDADKSPELEALKV
jgi:Xaa-Pro aminopeptidase